MKVKYEPFNPERSYYHIVMLNKYIRKGYSRKIAFNKAKREWKSALSANTWGGFSKLK